MPPELGVVIVSSRESRANDLRALLAKHFRVRITTTTTTEQINEKVYAIDPDVLVFDQSLLNSVAKNLELFQIDGESVFAGRFLIVLGSKPEQVQLNDDQFFELPSRASKEQVLNSIEKAAQSMGYLTSKGDVEHRLVQRQLDVTVEVQDTQFTGITTGLDLEGCGVRLAEFDFSISEGDHCRVSLNEPDLNGFVPAGGTIKEVAESWSDSYEAYVQIEFTGEGFPSNDLAQDVIHDMIKRQEDQSIDLRRDD